MYYVLDNYSNFPFENFSPPDCSAVTNSLEKILVLRRLGRLKNVLALYWITRNPPEPEESGFEKELRLRSPKTEEFNLHYNGFPLLDTPCAAGARTALDIGGS